MIPYWLMFLIPALTAIVAETTRDSTESKYFTARLTVGWLITSIMLIVIVGYRYQVGGDWFTYIGYLNYVRHYSLIEVMALADPGFMIINWISLEIGWGNIGVNLISSVIFSVGLIIFCRSLPRPWLGLSVAVPYLVIVVGMGYTRQGIALSLAMIALVSLQKGSLLRFCIWMIVAATFHKTATLLIPIAILAGAQSLRLRLILTLCTATFAYALLLAESVENLYNTYVDGAIQSQGALIRLMMNAIPAIVLLIYFKRFRFRSPVEAALWQWFAIISLLLLLILFATSASTAVDRIALYMLPLQLVVFSYAPEAFAPKRPEEQMFYVMMVLAYYALVLAVWLLFATHSEYWLPYRFFPLTD